MIRSKPTNFEFIIIENDNNPSPPHTVLFYIYEAYTLKLVDFHLHSPQNRFKWSTFCQKKYASSIIDVFYVLDYKEIGLISKHTC